MLGASSAPPPQGTQRRSVSEARQMYEPYGGAPKDERNFRSALRPANVQLSQESSQVTREQDSRMSQMGVADASPAVAHQE